MPTKAPPSLLDRDLSKADARERIDLAVPLLTEVVNNGLAVLMRCSTEAGGVAMRAEDEAILSLFRHALDAIDGIQALLAEACVEPCQVLLRTEFEAVISLLFIADSPTSALRTQRGQAYVVADLKKQLAELRRLDPISQEAKQALSKLAKDQYLKNVCLPAISDLASRIAEIESRLSGPDLLVAMTEFEKLRTTPPKKQRPAWYSLFGGPAKIEQLADRVEMAGAYEFIYRFWSGFVHGTQTVRDRRSNGWRRIRTTTGLPSAAQFAISFGLRATRTILRLYRPGESYQDWYTREIRPGFIRL